MIPGSLPGKDWHVSDISQWSGSAQYSSQMCSNSLVWTQPFIFENYKNQDIGQHQFMCPCYIKSLWIHNPRSFVVKLPLFTNLQDNTTSWTTNKKSHFPFISKLFREWRIWEIIFCVVVNLDETAFLLGWMKISYSLCFTIMWQTGRRPTC